MKSFIFLLLGMTVNAKWFLLPFIMPECTQESNFKAETMKNQNMKKREKKENNKRRRRRGGGRDYQEEKSKKQQ